MLFWSLVSFLLIVSIFLFLKFYFIKNQAEKEKEVIDIWKGKKLQNIEIDKLNRYYLLNDPEDSIDDQTWNDLELEIAFKKINRCITACGQQYLYWILRNNNKSSDYLAEIKNNKIYFEGIDHDELAKHYSQFNNTEGNKIFNHLFSDIEYIPIQNYIFYSILNITFLLCIPISSIFLVLFILLSSYNIFNHFRNKFIFSYNLETYIELRNYYSFAENILRYSKIIDKHHLKTFLRKTKFLHFISIKGNLGSLFYMIKETVFGLLNIEIILTSIFNNYLINKQKVIIDCLLEVAKFDIYCGRYFLLQNSKIPITIPKINNNIKLTNVFNPILNPSIPISFKLNEGGKILIFGSNMSGKSTFLRTLGINIVLGNKLDFCFAENAEIINCSIYSSLNTKDNIMEGKSYFLKEIERLQKFIEIRNGLILIDEIFKGTNSLEKFACSIAYLKYIAQSNNTILCTSHDIHISKNLNGLYSILYMNGLSIQKGQIDIEYGLSEKPKNIYGAISLLKHCKYPESIITHASKLAFE